MHTFRLEHIDKSIKVKLVFYRRGRRAMPRLHANCIPNSDFSLCTTER